MPRNKKKSNQTYDVMEIREMWKHSFSREFKLPRAARDVHTHIHMNILKWDTLYIYDLCYDNNI